jgi:hypothetical protein
VTNRPGFLLSEALSYVKLIGPMCSKDEFIFIILTERNIENKHETGVNESIILALV